MAGLTAPVTQVWSWRRTFAQLLETEAVLTSNDMPALIAALQSRQPRAGWREGEPTSTARVAIAPNVVVVLPLPEHAEGRLDTYGSAVSIFALGERHLGTIHPDAPPEDHADDICRVISDHIASRTARLEREAADLNYLREITEPDPLEGVTAEATTRAAAALTPPDADEVRVRRVPPLTDDDAAILLRAYKTWERIVDAVEKTARAPLVFQRYGLEPGVSFCGTYADTLRVKQTLSHLAAIAREWYTP